MLKLLIFLLSVSTANAQSFLTQTDVPTCLARSQAQCQLLGCDGVNTIYWWTCQGLTNGQAALVIQPSGPFSATTSNARGSGGLSAAEQANTKTVTQLGTALPFVISIVAFHTRFTPAQITAITGSTDTIVTTGWNAINGAATVNLTSQSVQNTVYQMVADGIIPNAIPILAPLPVAIP